jgi:hypothetical protein
MLTWVVALSGSTNTVVGLDAINGLPILESSRTNRCLMRHPFIPQSVKREEATGDCADRWSRRRQSHPDQRTGSGSSSARVLPGLAGSHRLAVEIRCSLEEGLACALDLADLHLILPHRGTLDPLDPLAYWLDRGWPEAEFFAFTGTNRVEHYRRYAAVIHLVTAADGAPARYTRWPGAHRPEQIEDAIRLDRLLHQVWRDHPHYYRLDNERKDWPAKSGEARRILSGLLVS